MRVVTLRHCCQHLLYVWKKTYDKTDNILDITWIILLIIQSKSRHLNRHWQYHVCIHIFILDLRINTRHPPFRARFITIRVKYLQDKPHNNVTDMWVVFDCTWLSWSHLFQVSGSLSRSPITWLSTLNRCCQMVIYLGDYYYNEGYIFLIKMNNTSS